MTETKKCTQCGQEKPIEDFSKSYKNLCKTCVAENVREKRKSIFEKDFTRKRSLFVEESSMQFIPHPRLTIATAALQGMLANGYYTNISPDIIVQNSVEYADKLLNELSKPKDENNQ